MTRENTVAVIYKYKRIPPNTVYQIIRFQRRIQRAIKGLVEEGFTHFILPVVDHNSYFPTVFTDAIEAERRLNPNIHLTIMLPYEIDRRSCLSPAESYYYLLT